MAEWPEGAPIDNERVVGIVGNPVTRSIWNPSIPVLTGSHHFRGQISRNIGDLAEFGFGGSADGLKSAVFVEEIGKLPHPDRSRLTPLAP